MTYDTLTLQLLATLHRHAGERRTVAEWAGAMPPITPTGHVRDRLTRLMRDGRVRSEATGKKIVYFVEK
jgi:hypothetical protein